MALSPSQEFHPLRDGGWQRSHSSNRSHESITKDYPDLSPGGLAGAHAKVYKEAFLRDRFTERPPMQSTSLRALQGVVAATLVLLLSGCATSPPPAPTRPAAWAAPETLVAPSAFHGVHGLAVDAKGRLLAGTVVGNNLWEVDRKTGDAKVLIGAPEGQADDIAVGPKGELAWTSYLQGVLRMRDSDGAATRVVAKDLPGINSLAFDQKNGKLYASQVFLGDALWEMDPAGKNPPRAIAKNLGGFNGFEVGPDGMLYGPLWFKGQIVRINPKDGSVVVINSEFKVPAAVNLDGKGNAWAIDTKTGELAKVNLTTGAKTVVARLATALDNLAISPEGTIYVSNMADNAITEVDPVSSRTRTLLSGALAVAGGMKLADGKLWIADTFAFRSIDIKTGQVADIARMQASDLEYPAIVGMGSRQIALVSWFTNTVQLVDRQTLKTVDMVHGFKTPYAAIPMDDGSLLVAEIATGNLLRVSGAKHETRQVVASGLAGPVQMVLGKDGALYLTEAAGNLVRINLATGAKTVVADKLAMPEGLAQTPWGSFIVAETLAARLTEIDPVSGARRTVADQLPIGLEGGPGMPPPYNVTGVDVGEDGVIYVSADRNNAVLKIRPKR
jgi:sugar lactone lactonase YvrE